MDGDEDRSAADRWAGRADRAATRLASGDGFVDDEPVRPAGLRPASPRAAAERKNGGRSAIDMPTRVDDDVGLRRLQAADDLRKARAALLSPAVMAPGAGRSPLGSMRQTGSGVSLSCSMKPLAAVDLPLPEGPAMSRLWP